MKTNLRKLCGCLLTGAMLFGLSACGQQGADQTKPDNSAAMGTSETASSEETSTESSGNREHKDPDFRPAIAGELPDLSSYNTIFIGYPKMEYDFNCVLCI